MAISTAMTNVAAATGGSCGTFAPGYNDSGADPSTIVLRTSRRSGAPEEGQGYDRPVDTERLAIECQWLRRTIDSSRLDPYVMICNHIIREGKDCVGPFLENIETDCGLWDPNEVARARALRRAAR